MPGYLSNATDLGLPIIDHKTLYYSPNKNTLMTKVSNFSGRRLPPPDARPSRLDDKLDFEFKVDNLVHVRQFDEEARTWSSWQQGVVLELVHLRYPLGCHAPGYRVRCTHMTGVTHAQIYRPFLGEICQADRGQINISPDLCIYRLEFTTQAYARTNNSFRVLGNGVQMHQIWVKSKIISWDQGQAPQVKILEGTFEGTCWPALELLPYNPETAAACIKRGDYVMAPGGRVFGGE